jgi:hypothetical protein
MQRDSLHRINSIAILAAAQIAVQMEFLEGTVALLPEGKLLVGFPFPFPPTYRVEPPEMAHYN